MDGCATGCCISHNSLKNVPGRPLIAEADIVLLLVVEPDGFACTHLPHSFSAAQCWGVSYLLPSTGALIEVNNKCVRPVPEGLWQCSIPQGVC
jgi:hypothetical protein